MKRFALFAVFFFSLALAGSAQAHANLRRSEPAAGEVLERSPAEMVLEFTEDLDPNYSQVQLFNSQNELINEGPGVIETENPQILTLVLASLPKDSYTAVWRARSAIDGHVTEGIIPFGIGVKPEVGSLIPARNFPDPALENPPLAESGLRWLTLSTAIVAFGSIPFVLFVLNPFSELKQAKTYALLIALLRRLIIAGCLAFVLSNLGFLMLEASTLAGEHFFHVFGSTLGGLLSGYSGRLLIGRVALASLVGIIAWQESRTQLSRKNWVVMLGLAGLCLLTFSSSSHGAALKNGATTAVFIDWLHITATVSWLGGLVPLLGVLILVRRGQSTSIRLRKIIPRFSKMAITCVIILGVSGSYSYIIHVNNFDYLSATSYGRALVIKTGLFAMLLMLGALNFRIWSPRLKKAGNAMAGLFGITVRIELVLGALLLLAVGAMTSIAPSVTAWMAHQETWARVLTLEQRNNNVSFVFQIAPNRVGSNELAIDITDRRRGENLGPTEVIMRLTKVGGNLGVLQLSTERHSDQRYTAEGNFFSMPGEWKVEVILRRPGFTDATATFDFDVAP